MVKKSDDQIEFNSTSVRALNRAVDLCGSRQELARRIGCLPQHLNHWLNNGGEIPLHYVPFIVASVNDPEVTLFTLRPDYQAGWLLLAKLLTVVNVAPPKGIAARRAADAARITAAMAAAASDEAETVNEA